MTTVRDLRVNRPEGLFRLTGLTWLEAGALEVEWTVLANGDPVDLSGCTVDLATITPSVTGAQITPVTVTLGADGLVTLTAELDVEAVQSRSHPHGMEAILTVRLLDGSTPFYLVAPSTITIANGTGSAS